jgi:hypothetical protein
MAAKTRKRGFDIPSTGPSDTGWVYRSDEGAAKPGETADPPAAAPPAATQPAGGKRASGAGAVRRSSTGTYTKAPVATPPRRSKENNMETNTTGGAQTPGTLLVNGAKVLGEVAVVPGASLIVDGNVKSGIVHAASGLLGVAILGPVLGPLTWLAVGADSYSRSVSGKTIVDQFRTPKQA